MKKINIYSLSLFLSVVSVLLVFIMIYIDKTLFVGPFSILFFIFLAIGFRGNENLKRFAYTILIFAAVTTALFYPQLFVQWGTFKLTALIIPFIQIIMFGMGTSMRVNDFVSVVKTPRGVVIGVMSQFIIMPTLGFILASVSGFAPEIAAGIILVGCSPSGLASNVMSYLAKANLALSITITSITTLLAPFITPLLMKLLAGALIEINVLNMMWDISKMIILPIGLGLLYNRLLAGKSIWLEKAMPVISMTGIALVIVVITAAGRDSLLTIGPLLILVVLVHNFFGYLLGYYVARLFKMNEQDSRTVAIEVGMQNAGLASGIAKEMGKIATVGLAAAVFGPIMNISGSTLASYWHKKTPKGYNENEELDVVVQSH